jgi:hypothetical protein
MDLRVFGAASRQLRMLEYLEANVVLECRFLTLMDPASFNCNSWKGGVYAGRLKNTWFLDIMEERSSSRTRVEKTECRLWW